MIKKLILWAAGNPRNETSQMVLQLTEELENLKKELDCYKIVAWAKTNNHGDLYDLRIQNNPYYNQNSIVPLYAKLEN